jgi:hypothetical protein
MPEGAALAGLLWALGIGLAIGTLIEAIFLRAAVALHNKMAGDGSSPSRVPEPALGKAMRITFDIWLAQLVLGVVIGCVTGTGPTATGAGKKDGDFVLLLIAIPVRLLITTAILSERLPTTYGRAFHVTVCDMVLVVLVVGVIVAIAVVLFGVVVRGT